MEQSASPRQREAAAEWVRESLNVPTSPPPAQAMLGSDAEGLGLESRSSSAVAGVGGVVGNEGGLCGTMSIVERIQQLDRQKKLAVARCSAANICALLRGVERAYTLWQVARAAGVRGHFFAAAVNTQLVHVVRLRAASGVQS
jgi:hypothetical protein